MDGLPVYNEFTNCYLNVKENFLHECYNLFPFFICYKLEKLEQFNDWYNSIEKFSIMFRCYAAICYDKVQHDCIREGVDGFYDCQFQIDFLQFFIFETIDDSLHNLVYGCRSIKEFIKKILNYLKSKSPDLKMTFLDINKNYTLDPAFKRVHKEEYETFIPDIVNLIRFLDIYLKFKSVYANNKLYDLAKIIDFRMIDIDIDEETLKEYYNVNQLKTPDFNMFKLKEQLRRFEHKGLFDYIENYNIESDCYKQIVNYVKMHTENSIDLFYGFSISFKYIPFPRIESTFYPVFLMEFLHLNFYPDHDKTELTKILNELKMNETTLNNIIRAQKNISEKLKIDFLFRPDPNVIYENVPRLKLPIIPFVRTFLNEYFANSINNTN